MVQVKAFVELAGSLLSAGSARGQSSQALGLTGEMIRFMRSSGVINALIIALKLIDMDHPKVSIYMLPLACHVRSPASMILTCTGVLQSTRPLLATRRGVLILLNVCPLARCMLVEISV